MESKDEIKQKLDVAEVIGGYLQLKPAGSGSFKAVCPFHSEKTPSFYISQEKQIWHCFGCDKGGDIISFVMDIEGIDFKQALRQLGQKAGVEVPDYKPDESKDEKDIVYDLHELAGKFYQKILDGHELGESARKYIIERGIDGQLLKKFRLGVALDRWTSLCEFLQKRGISESLIIKSGLAKQKQSGDGAIDRFRNRLMIPLCDASGRIVGFTGRLLGVQDDKSGPKYLNSPETLIYHKSDVLYGLHLAKKAVRQEKSIIIVEGNLDVVASHKAGVENVVASSGTALTESQLRQLKKITNKLLFCFDSDAAGFAAAQRGIRLAQGMDFNIQVISIPDNFGKDPDDVVKNNPESWKNLTQNPIHIMQYYINNGSKSLNLADVQSKKKFVKNILSEIAYLHDQVGREHWLQQLADMSRTEISVLRNILRTPPLNSTISGNGRSSSVSPSVTELSREVKKSKTTSRPDNVTSIIIGILINFEEFIPEVLNNLSENEITDQKWREVYKKIILAYNQVDLSDSTPKSKIPLYIRLQDQLSEEVRRALLKTEELTNGMSEKSVREELNRHIEILRSATQKERRRILEADIRQAEMSGNKEKLQDLLKEYKKLLSN